MLCQFCVILSTDQRPWWAYHIPNWPKRFAGQFRVNNTLNVLHNLHQSRTSIHTDIITHTKQQQECWEE